MQRITACLFLAYSACVQTSSGQSKRVSVIAPQPIAVKPGRTVSQVTEVTVQDGSHVNSEKPRGEYLIPFRLDWETTSPLTVTGVHYPASEELQVGTEKLLVYTGTFGVKTDFQVAPNATPGMIELKGKLHYQACNTQMCFRPATADVVLPVRIQ